MGSHELKQWVEQGLFHAVAHDSNDDHDSREREGYACQSLYVHDVCCAASREPNCCELIREAGFYPMAIVARLRG